MGCCWLNVAHSILRGDMVIADLVTNSWLEAMEYTVPRKVLIVLRHLASSFVGALHVEQCKNTSDDKHCRQTNQT